MSDIPDRELLAWFRAGDANGLRILFERYEAAVRTANDTDDA